MCGEAAKRGRGQLIGGGLQRGLQDAGSWWVRGGDGGMGVELRGKPGDGRQWCAVVKSSGLRDPGSIACLSHSLGLTLGWLCSFPLAHWVVRTLTGWSEGLQDHAVVRKYIVQTIKCRGPGWWWRGLWACRELRSLLAHQADWDDLGFCTSPLSFSLTYFAGWL